MTVASIYCLLTITQYLGLFVLSPLAGSVVHLKIYESQMIWIIILDKIKREAG